VSAEKENVNATHKQTNRERARGRVHARARTKKLERVTEKDQ